MSLAALGCDPEQTWTEADGTDGPGIGLGTIGYSPDGGMYLCVQAKAAISQYDACVLQDTFRANPLTTTNGDIGATVCFPQVAMANHSYGWGLVAGKGRVNTDGTGAANESMGTSGTAGQIHGSTSNVLGGMHLTKADGASNGECIVMFPTIVN